MASAATLASAFLVDMWALLATLRWAGPVIASTDPLPEGLLPDATVWLQGEGPLDARLERILGRALQTAPAAIALGADSPGLPRALLDLAALHLMRGQPVIGPADDGGFYLLGLPTCPPGLLADIPWSAPDTCAATVARLTARGMPPAVLPPWFDVDRAEDLPRLRAWLTSDPTRAPTTAAALREPDSPA